MDVDPMLDGWRNPALSLSPPKAAQRIRALSESLQHGLPASLAGSSRAAWASLGKGRWCEPRVGCSVYHGEAITLLMPISKPEARWWVLSRIAKSAGAQANETRREMLMVDSAQWEPMAFELIEAGALLRRVSVPGYSEREATLLDGVSNPCGEFRWDQLFQGIRAVARAANGE